jgi:protein SCO1/2
VSLIFNCSKPRRASLWKAVPGGSFALGCFLFVIPATLLLGGCSPSASSQPPAVESSRANVQTYQVKGVVTKMFPGNKSVEIRHQEVTNFMPAMTMEFQVKNPNELAGLTTNDPVMFRLSVTDNDSWIDQITKAEGKKAEAKSLTELPATNGFRFVRDVDPLQVGDPLPEYHFTNQLGQAVSTTQFKGQALAITFIFTRCPLPNFCPRMSSNFETVQSNLLKGIASPSSNPQPSTLNPQPFTNWHLFTITFDPEFDNVAVLKSYAERYHADPAHWSFLTGDPTDIRAIADQFNESFWKDETGAINHNLRTVVVNASGKIQKIFTGNNWAPEELVAEMADAAKSEAPK